MESDDPSKLKERIKELEKENEQLRESSNKFKTFYEHAPFPYHSLDPNGNIIDVNPEWFNTLGYKREEVTGKPFRNFLHKDFQFQFDTNFSEFKKRGYLHNMELQMKHKKGYYIDVLFEGYAGYQSDGIFKQTYCTFKDITQQKEAEIDLQKKNEELEKQKAELTQYKRMVEASKDIMAVVDSDYKFLWVNSAFLKYHQLSKGEVLGNTADEILGEQFFKEKIQPYLEKCFNGKNVQQDIIGQSPEFGQVHLDINYYPLEKNQGIDGVVAVMRDITERKKYEEELLNAKDQAKESEKLAKKNLSNIKFLADSAINFVDFPYDKDIYNYIVNKIKEITPTASAIVVLKVNSHNHIVQTKAVEISDENINNLIEEKGIQLLGKKYVYDNRLFGLDDGAIKKVDIGIHELTFETLSKNIAFKLERQLNLESIYGIAFMLNGKIYATAFILYSKGNDLENKETLETFIKQASLAFKRRETEEELRASNEELKELNATKDKFFSIIGHDLRNPFNTLLGMSELLKSNALKYPPEKVQYFAQQMHNSTKSAYNLLDNLLEWARIQRGELEPDLKEVNPTEIINEVKELTKPLANSKDINVQTAPESDDHVLADKEMLKTILRNLVTNSIKYTYSQGTVIMSTQRLEHSLQFTVSDTGMGIPSEYLDRLFEPDCDLSEQGTEKEKGTGLGLILCKEFVEKQGGKIWVESEVGKGSDFHFTIPFGRPIK